MFARDEKDYKFTGVQGQSLPSDAIRWSYVHLKNFSLC